jgi:hypothetical protein
LLWIGLIVTHCQHHNQSTIKQLDLSRFQQLVLKHWHRGIQLLAQDWEEAESDYERFLQILTNHCPSR